MPLHHRRIYLHTVANAVGAETRILLSTGITIGASCTPGSIALLASQLPMHTAHTALVTGRRYGGIDALAAGLVDDIAAEAEVLTKAVARARTLTTTRGQTLGETKNQLYSTPLSLLRTPAAGIATQNILQEN